MRNQPTIMIHIPLIKRPLNIMENPMKMKRNANPWPTVEAMPVALFRFPVNFQTMARRTRPPSMGKPGRRLKAPRKRLMNQRYLAIAERGSLTERRIEAKKKQRIAIAKLVKGPTKAMKNSFEASLGSSEIWATPPRMNRVIRLTFSPCLTATRE